jgi:hypothetical protein
MAVATAVHLTPRYFLPAFFRGTAGAAGSGGPPAFRARIMPMRGSIVGPPFSATRIRASIAASHFGASCSAFGSFVM